MEKKIRGVNKRSILNITDTFDLVPYGGPEVAQRPTSGPPGATFEQDSTRQAQIDPSLS